MRKLGYCQGFVAGTGCAPGSRGLGRVPLGKGDGVVEVALARGTSTRNTETRARRWSCRAAACACVRDSSRSGGAEAAAHYGSSSGRAESVQCAVGAARRCVRSRCLCCKRLGR